jgi:Family of unknown function (DUF6502)
MNTPTNLYADHDVLSQEQALLQAALDKVLRPLADLCLAKGLSIQLMEERLRVAFVESAVDSLGKQPTARLHSRISASTGLTRREVARIQALTDGSDPALNKTSRKTRPASATELFTRWVTDPALRAANGQPMALPRLARLGIPDSPSFERLAQSVTQDVHPRSLLDELCRLGLALWDTESDEVLLTKSAFVPRGDWARMTAFLADNVGDHLRAASANVLGSGKEHMEQAIFADELSVQSLQVFRDMMATQWQLMLDSLVPRLEQLIAGDKQAGRIQNQRVRIGLYTWSQPMAGNTRRFSVVPKTGTTGTTPSPHSNASE